MLKITSQLIIDEVTKRGWKSEIINEKKAFYRFWTADGTEYVLRSNTSAKTAAVQYLIANNKEVANYFAKEAGLAVPETVNYSTPDAALEMLHKYQRLVVKPLDAAHGNGVSTNVDDPDKLIQAVQMAKKFSTQVLLQPFITGDDYRLLFIGGELAAAAIREPASVVGDGTHNIKELIELENQNPDR